ncbi:MAG: hypothetical protein RL326_579 [Pseudomonadota bacterium]|jgi:hypothetical protein
MNTSTSDPSKLSLCAATNVEDMVRLERLVWPAEIRASHESFRSRLTHFPQGVIGAYVAGRLVGLSTSMRVNWSRGEDLKSWETVTDNGLIRTHQPDGNALYVVSIGAEKLSHIPGIGAALIQGQIALGERLSLDHIVLGSRVPGYRDWNMANGGSLADYLSQTNEDGLILDPLLRFFTRQGLAIQRAISGYMEDDPESLNYGVIMSRALRVPPVASR